MEYKYIKRIIDIILSSSLIVILSPLFCVVSIIIKLESDGPVLFKQERAGLKGKPFNIYKFRTMKKDNDVYNFNKKDKVTSIGKILRPLGIDELPQLLNILKGEMSFIGPRPYLTKYTEYYTEEQKKRLNVLPGLFGPADCENKKIAILDRIIIDFDYVKNYSLKQDLKVTAKLIFNYINLVSYRKKNASGNKEIIKEDYQSLIDNFNKEKEAKEAPLEQCVKVFKQKTSEVNTSTDIAKSSQNYCIDNNSFTEQSELINYNEEKPTVLIKKKIYNCNTSK